MGRDGREGTTRRREEQGFCKAPGHSGHIYLNLFSNHLAEENNSGAISACLSTCQSVPPSKLLS